MLEDSFEDIINIKDVFNQRGDQIGENLKFLMR